MNMELGLYFTNNCLVVLLEIVMKMELGLNFELVFQGVSNENGAKSLFKKLLLPSIPT